jgi:SAM-dependent methyltransferase
MNPADQLEAGISTACPVCGASEHEVFVGGRDDPLKAADIGSSRKEISCGMVLRCRKCQFGFRRARSNAQEMAELYRRMDTAVYQAERHSRERTARAHLGIVQRILRCGQILDVGCAAGIFLQQAADAGWRVTGLEPSEELYAQASRNLAGRGEVYPCTLEHAVLQPGFDAITLWDVLEHVPDPLGFLTICRKLLSAGGYLFVNVPDLDSVQRRVLGARWPLFLAEHLNYFNRSSLRGCAGRAGLKLVGFGRRSAWFSVAYTAYRLGQHRIPLSGTLYNLTSRFKPINIPLRLGETYGVFQAP